MKSGAIFCDGKNGWEAECGSKACFIWKQKEPSHDWSARDCAQCQGWKLSVLYPFACSSSGSCSYKVKDKDVHNWKTIVSESLLDSFGFER